MRTLVITSSYPSKSRQHDGVFVQEFVKQLRGSAFVLAPTRGELDGISDFKLPWLGGSRSLSDLKLSNPINWLIALHFFIAGSFATVKVCRRLKIDRVLCFWAIPSGVFGLAAKIFAGVRFDVVSLGSDIWKFKGTRLGREFLRLILRAARCRWADGFSLMGEMDRISGRASFFLPLARELPAPKDLAIPKPPIGVKTFLFVGRYHHNKGPDQLIKAIAGMYKAQRAEIRVYLFGFGEMGGNLHKQIAEAGLEEIVQIGEEICAQSLSDWLHWVDYLVIPSRIDSIPVIATDAIRANCPIIAMPVGDLPWLVNYFNCGLLAPTATPEGLRSAMLKATFSIKRDTFLPGCQAAAKRFDIKASATHWEDLWC